MASWIEKIFVSAGHNYFGHHGRAADAFPISSVASVRCLAGRGLEGDRFCDYRVDYHGQVTFFSAEIFDELCETLTVKAVGADALRRNIVTRGIDLRALEDTEFTLQGVRFRGAGECKPCYWMDQAIAPGAETWLRGRGGLRARILSDGELRVGAAELTVAESELAGLDLPRR